MSRKKCLVFGAGALGLGFLGPELAPWLDMTFIDVKENAPLLSHLTSQGYYIFNETGPAARSIRVENVSGMAADEADAISGLLAGADLAFTAVGESNLSAVAPVFAQALEKRGKERPLRVLCSENGIDIAAKFRQHVSDACGCEPGSALLTGDTVMGRMCKLISPVTVGLEPLAPGLNTAVAGEPYYGIPAPAQVLHGMEGMPASLAPMPPKKFSAHEDVKMLGHNGLHAFFSFMAEHRDPGAECFCDLVEDTVLMDMAREMLNEEVAPALLSRHRGVLDRNYLMNYLTTIMRRITCRGLNDPIARGTRGVLRKLQPWERLVGSVRAIDEEGIRPRIYARGLAAAVLCALEENQTDLDFDTLLTDHCGFDPGKDRLLIGLIKEQAGQIRTGL